MRPIPGSACVQQHARLPTETPAAAQDMQPEAAVHVQPVCSDQGRVVCECKACFGCLVACKPDTESCHWHGAVKACSRCNTTHTSLSLLQEPLWHAFSCWHIAY